MLTGFKTIGGRNDVEYLISLTVSIISPHKMLDSGTDRSEYQKVVACHVLPLRFDGIYDSPDEYCCTDNVEYARWYEDI